jgi:hypothetical protein
MMLSMQLCSVSFSSSSAFLEILLKHAAMDAHKFWLPLQIYCLSMETSEFFSSKCGYFDFSLKKSFALDFSFGTAVWEILPKRIE